MPLDDVQREQLQEFQMVAANFLTHPRLRDVVEALTTDDADENFSRAESDTKKFLQSMGIELPAKCRASISRNSPIHLSVCVGVHEFYCLNVTLPEIHVVHTTPS